MPRCQLEVPSVPSIVLESVEQMPDRTAVLSDSSKEREPLHTGQHVTAKA